MTNEIKAARILIARMNLINALDADIASSIEIYRTDKFSERHIKMVAEERANAERDATRLYLSLERAEFDSLDAAVKCAEALLGTKVVK